MAKSSRSPRPSSPRPMADRAEAWLSAAERTLLDSTIGRPLAAASGRRLEATIARVRRLHDKWRKQFARQMHAAGRKTKDSRPVDSHALDKADLFAAALRRLDARRVELVAEAAAARRTSARAGSRPAISKKAGQASARRSIAAADGLVGYDAGRQRSAKASATATRIKLDGLTTRRRGHTLMAGKRRQARRDGR